jgi:uncharacterized protein (TIGR00369 family)
MKIQNGTLPWTKSCFVCGENNPHGLHLRSRLESGRIILEYQIREADAGYRHILHGGIAVTLLDEVMTWAAIVHSRKVFVAAEISIRFLGPIFVGDRVRVEGWVNKISSRLCLTEGMIKNSDGKVLVSAVGKFMPMSPDYAKHVQEDFVFRPGAIDPKELSINEGSD